MIRYSPSVRLLLSRRRILRFWLPLEATWLMMAIEGPFLAAVIARMPAPKENLAAFGVAAALAWIIESPIIMMLSASNALCRDRIAYHKLRRFSFTLNGAVTVIMLALVMPPVFRVVVLGIMGLPPEVAGLAGKAIGLLILWPAAIGFRRFYQGILIRSGRPQAVTWGTVIRLSTMAVTGLLLALVAKLSGASVGAGAMGAGVIAEGTASWAMARSTIRALNRQPDEDCDFGRELTAARIRKFYAPLALTSFLSFFINPLTSFFMARGREPVESLAVLPVIIGLAFMFRTAGISLQEVVIALIGDEGQHRAELARFTKQVAALSTIALGAVVFTPLAMIWYHVVSGLSVRPERVRLLARRPSRIAPAFGSDPVLSAGRAGQVAQHEAHRHSGGGAAGPDHGRVRRHHFRLPHGRRAHDRHRPDGRLRRRQRRPVRPARQALDPADRLIRPFPPPDSLLCFFPVFRENDFRSIKMAGMIPRKGTS